MPDLGLESGSLGQGILSQKGCDVILQGKGMERLSFLILTPSLGRMSTY